MQGNRKTDPALILRELGIVRGDVLTADDPRVQAAELRLISLGYFRRVALKLRAIQRQRGSVALIVEVEERGTAILNALYLGTSEATLLWGGLDVSETNFLGRGIVIGGGAVGSTTPTVPEAIAGRALTLRAAGPRRREGLLLAGSLLFSKGSEFWQAFGLEDEVDPTKWRAVQTQRLGGTLTVGGELSRTVRFYVDGRYEFIEARLPGIRSRDLGGSQARPIDFYIHEGDSHLSSLAGTLDFDTRSDPVLPARGRRLILSIEAAVPVLGSSYSFAKGVAQGSTYIPAWRQHVLAFHGLAGAIFGDAPYFDRFFVGDLNFLLPPRALGLNFATLPSRNALDTSIASHRYESFAARALVEYAIPLWRGRGASCTGAMPSPPSACSGWPAWTTCACATRIWARRSRSTSPPTWGCASTPISASSPSPSPTAWGASGSDVPVAARPGAAGGPDWGQAPVRPGRRAPGPPGGGGPPAALADHQREPA